jgi:hypothetical protein
MNTPPVIATYARPKGPRQQYKLKDIGELDLEDALFLLALIFAFPIGIIMLVLRIRRNAKARRASEQYHVRMTGR